LAPVSPTLLMLTVSPHRWRSRALLCRQLQLGAWSAPASLPQALSEEPTRPGTEEQANFLARSHHS
jgi:hypothetical protein